MRASVRVVLPVLLVGGLVVLAALRVVEGQVAALRALDSRFQARADSAADFIAAYMDDLADRQQSHAMRVLASPMPNRHDFDDVVTALDFAEAVLVDERGRVLHRHPRAAGEGDALVPHALSVLAGGSFVSGVLSADARGPVIAVAVPFETPSGRRVLSGSYPPDGTPLGRFLDNAVPLPSAKAWLVDGDGRLVANSGPWDEGARLARTEPALPADVLVTEAGDYEQDGDARHFAVAPVAGTSWRIVETVSHEKLYAPVRRSELVPRATLAALFATALFALLLFWRLLRSETRLAEAVRTDVLTGLPNRRCVEERLRAMVAAAARQGRPCAVLVVDVDRFKQVNDTVGHLAGDQVLAACADRMSRVLRADEAIGRWGGEEFLVLLPDATAEQARVVGERLRQAVHLPLVVGDHMLVPSVSIGAADVQDDDVIGVLRAADDALYAAKAGGRDRVEVATPVLDTLASVTAPA